MVLVLLVCSFGRLYVVEWLSVENEAASHLAQAYVHWAVLMSGLTSKQGCLCLAVLGCLGLLDSSQEQSDTTRCRKQGMRCAAC